MEGITVSQVAGPAQRASRDCWGCMVHSSTQPAHTCLLTDTHPGLPGIRHRHTPHIAPQWPPADTHLQSGEASHALPFGFAQFQTDGDCGTEAAPDPSFPVPPPGSLTGILWSTPTLMGPVMTHMPKAIKEGLTPQVPPSAGRGSCSGVRDLPRPLLTRKGIPRRSLPELPLGARYHSGERPFPTSPLPTHVP